jgi:hypothetical protein
MKDLRYIAKFLMLLAIAVSACQEEEIDYDPGNPRPSVGAYTTTSNSLLINASPGAKSPQKNPPVVFYMVNNVLVTTTNPVDTVEFNYLNTPSNRGILATPSTQIRFINKDGNTSMGANNFNVRQGRSYSTFLIDTLGRSGGHRVLQFEDNLTAPSSGRANVRFINLSPNAPEVYLSIQADSSDFYNLLIPPSTPNASLPSTSVRRYAETSRRIGADNKDFALFVSVPAGTYDLNVSRTGSKELVTPLSGTVFSAGKIYTVYLRGLVGGDAGQEIGATIIQHN